MTDIIKQRIEQIRSGKIPDGYIRTKAGIMPTDWKCDVQAKYVFKSCVNKEHNGYCEILAATQDNGIVPRSQLNKEIQCSDEGINGYKKVDKGDFIISLRSFQGGIEFSNYEGFVSPAYTVLKPTRIISSDYYKYYFKSEDFISRLNGAVYGIRDGKQIGYEDFGNLYIHFPPLEEQQKIAKILTQCNNVIAMYKRELEEIKMEKNFFLNKMFSQNGSSVPELRFPGFTDAWEQRKLGDVGKARAGVGFPDSEQGGDEGVPFFKVSDMNNAGNENEMMTANNYVSEAQIAAHKWNPITEIPAIFFAKVGAAVMLNRKRLCRFPFLLDNNTMAYSLDMNYWNADFAKALFETVDLTALIQVGALPSYNAGGVESMKIRLPSIKEQEQVGAYFKSLDNLIALHQCKLDEQMKMEKALEQLLLKGIVRVKI